MSRTLRLAEFVRKPWRGCVHFLLAAAPVLAAPAAAQPAASGSIEYRVPPEPIASAVEARGQPFVLVSPARDRLAVLSRSALPGIAELAEPELGLAGLTTNPRNNGPSRTSSYSGVTFSDVQTGETVEVDLPAEARLIAPEWSPDGHHLAFLLLKEETVELWTAEAASGRAALRAASVNAAFPKPYSWFADGSGLLVRLVPEGRGAAPAEPRVPKGPVVRESSGKAAPSQTIQNLLSNAHDEALFEHFFTSRLAISRLDGDGPVPLGEPGLIADAAPSPDGRFILQRRLKKPFSYALPASAFPEEVLVTDVRGRLVRTIADRPAPLVDRSGAPAGPRAVRWRADAPATLFWAEAADGERPRERLFLLDAPFRSPPRLLAELDMRFQDILWGRPDLALVTGLAPEGGAEHRVAVDPSRTGVARLLQRRTFRGGGEAGTVLEWREDLLHLTPDGAGLMMRVADGLATMDFGSGALTRLWSEQPGERLIALLDREGRRLLSWREGPDAPPNLFLVPRGGDARRISDFTDPAPAYAGMQARHLSYRRADGRALSGTLYLPAGYEASRDGPLPLLIWAYPASVTGPQRPVRAPSGHRFVRPTGFDDLPLLLTGRGYAVFEAGMPIFGSEESPPNDTHVPQLVANAEAAIAAVAGTGAAMPDRVAIGGHSYGAAMAANLLAHSDLFRTGIALSGAYNRTLTPFGFQASERRSFWEAPEAYMAMSPFIHADRIDEPLLLVHGAADDNSGTHLMQSERLYAALSGLGRDVRYVLLPSEGHQYRARESQMHLMWEMDRWLAMHLGLNEDAPR